MIPAWTTFPALAACALAGLAIDRATGRQLGRLGGAAWPVHAATGLGIVLAALLHPAAPFALGALMIAAGRADTAAGHARAREPVGSFGVALGAIALVAWARPAFPLYWDELVWLAKARVAAGDPLALRAAALDPDGGLIPTGYPIFGPLAGSLLALGRADTAALVAGAWGLTLLCAATALALLPPAARPRVALALALVPLSWPHLRSAYLDLPVGLLALALAAALDRAATERWAGRVAVTVAFVLAGLKDEGMVFVLALASAHALVGRSRASLGRAGLAALGGALCAGSWALLLRAHGVANTDHALGLDGLADAPEIVAVLLRAALDPISFGLAAPLSLGAVLAAARGDRRERGLALGLLFSLSALTLALVLGGERLRSFATDGTLSGRMLLELVPLAAWLVVHSVSARSRPAETAARVTP